MEEGGMNWACCRIICLCLYRSLITLHILKLYINGIFTVLNENNCGKKDAELVVKKKKEKKKKAELWEELNENKMKTVSSLHSFRKLLCTPAIFWTLGIYKWTE